MKAALIQMSPLWERPETNLEAAGELLGRAAQGGADVAVLPEMFQTGFTMNTAAMAEDEDGPTARFLSDRARELGINIIAGFSARVPDTPADNSPARNLAHVYGRDGRLLASYEKMHPFSYADEDRHYTSGGGPVVFELDGMAATVFICYDLRFPEALRTVAPKVEAAFYIANWPASRAAHWEALLTARAIENQCFLVGVNRRGTEPSGISYSGGSTVISPMGETLCRATEDEDLLVCEFEPAEVKKTREKFPFLGDIRK